MSNIYNNLEKGKPWFTLFAIEAYMESKDIKITPENQKEALIEFQKSFDPDLLFPIMDLDEYLEFVSKAEDLQDEISKSQDWAQFEPDQIINVPETAQIENSSTYKVLKSLYEDKKDHYRYLGGYIPTPYTLISLIIDLQAASELVIYKPEFLKTLVKFSEPIIEHYAKMISKFVDTFFLLAPSECTIMKKSYINIVQPSMNKLIKYCAKELDKPTLIHFCSKKVSQVVNDDVLAPMKDSGILGLNIPAIIDSIELAERYDLILCGGIDPVNIQIRSRQETFQELKKILQKTKNLRYIFATNCQIKYAPGQISSEEFTTLLTDIKNLIK